MSAIQGLGNERVLGVAVLASRLVGSVGCVTVSDLIARLGIGRRASGQATLPIDSTGEVTNRRPLALNSIRKPS
jgi:hypothetical protein